MRRFRVNLAMAVDPINPVRRVDGRLYLTAGGHSLRLLFAGAIVAAIIGLLISGGIAAHEVGGGALASVLLFNPSARSAFALIGWYPARLYGALGDWNGTTGTDDTTSLQNAVNAANTAGGGHVYLRGGGAYKFSSLTLAGKNRVHIVGAGREVTSMVFTSTTGTVFDLTAASFCEIRDMTIKAASQKTAGALIYVDHGAGVAEQNAFRRMWLQSCYRGFELEDCGTTTIDEIQFGDVNGAWGWDSAIKLTGTAISTTVTNIRGGTAAQMASGFCLLNAAGIDTFHAREWDILNFPVAGTGSTTSGSPTVTSVTNPAQWRNGMRITGAGIPALTNIVSGGGTSTLTLSQNASATASGVALLASDGMLGLVVNGGTWAKFDSVSIECGKNDAVTINGGIETHLNNCHLLGNSGLLVQGGTGTKMIGGTVLVSIIHSVLLAGGTDTLIQGVNIIDIGAGIGGSSGWNGIDVAPNVSDFVLIDNIIGRSVIYATTANYGIRVQAGTSNNYRIRGNRSLNYTAASASGVLNLGTGTNQDVGGNAGLTTGGYEIGLKLPVRVAATTNITISGPGATIDGVTMAAGDRVLLAGQTTASQNGIYIWNGAAVAMTRATDANTAAKLTDSLLVTVDEGAVATRDSIFSLSTNKPITLDTTSLAFKRVDMLMSPWVPLLGPVAAQYGTGQVAATSAMGFPLAAGPVASGFSLLTTNIPTFRIDPADYALLAGKSLEWRIVATLLGNTVAVGTVTFTVGLYPITPAGAAGALTATIGTLIVGSGAAIVNPGASADVRTVGPTFTTALVAGHYILALVSNAAMAANSAVRVEAELQYRLV